MLIVIVQHVFIFELHFPCMAALFNFIIIFLVKCVCSIEIVKCLFSKYKLERSPAENKSETTWIKNGHIVK